MPTAKKAEKETNHAPYTEKMTAAAHESVDKASVHASAAEERIRETVDSTSETLAGKKAAVELELGTAADQARKLVVENPLMAAGVAFTAGLLITSLLSKRS